MSENERVARIETSYEYITELLKSLDKKVDGMIDELKSNYVPRHEYGILVKEVEDLKKAKGALPAWAGILISFLTTVAIFLAGLQFKK